MYNANISVIIPAYNCINSIQTTIDSILGQSLLPIEIIVIDDGSQDGTSELLDQISKDYPILNIIHQPNQGVTNARNRGVLEAHGEWITFVDADDKLPTNTIYDYNNAISDKYDIIIGIFGIRKRYPNPIIDINSYRKAIIEEKIPHAPWGKLFRRKIFSTYVFDIPREIIIGEDHIMNLRLSFASDKDVAVINKELYIYTPSDCSISNNFKSTASYEYSLYNLIKISVPNLVTFNIVLLSLES